MTLRSKLVARSWMLAWAPAVLGLSLTACSGDDYGDQGSTGGTTTGTMSTGTGGGGQGGQGGGGQGGQGGGAGLTLDAILDALRADRDGAMRTYSAQVGWPIELPEGHLFVSTDPALTLVAGDHDGWSGTAMTADQGFHWLVLPSAAPGGHYKFTDLTTWAADPWSRSYTYDNFGEMSLIAPSEAHLDRYFEIGDAQVDPRTLRVWVPEGPIDRVLYAHDGQNLYNPAAPFGYWNLQTSALPGMLIVGIDNTPARMDEYTHVQDDIGDPGAPNILGGKGDAYADFLEGTVRPLIKERYGEPGPLGLMGSSLGGLISLHVADRYPGTYAFAASLSGTMGWGSIGPTTHNETMIERYATHTATAAVVYLDSGGVVEACVDTDGDGIDDDNPGANDNYCETLQMRDTLIAAGVYEEGTTLHYWHELGAEHNEGAWAARVFRPLEIFAGL